jgi:beta-lactamase superfamily II metal-dependent hydrolase
MTFNLIRRVVAGFTLFFAAGLLCGGSLAANEKDGRLEIYFIDVEGGAATLLVTPEGESLLIDSGYPDYGGRDRDRILKTLKAAGRKDLDHALISHFHLDHYGNHAALASVIPIRHFWDRGIPEELWEDKDFPDRIAKYRAASQNKSKKLSVGDKLPLKSGKTSLTATVITASGNVLPNAGAPNPYSQEHKPQPEDRSDNARSISILFQFGDFRFLTCGDLTWNTEAKLMMPKNPVGTVDLFMVTHHGLSVSNNPVLVLAIDPTVTVMCNGPAKGGDLETQKTLRRIKSRQASFQLHRNLSLKPEEQTPADFIANGGKTEGCEGIGVKATVSPDGHSYTVQIGNDGKAHSFTSRKQ